MSSDFPAAAIRPVSGVGAALRSKGGQRGSALLAALCFATVLTIALGSYLTLCYTTLATSTRNLNSTHSIELAEAGMEEVLWTLKANSNAGDWSGWSIVGTTATKTIANYAVYNNGATGSMTLTVTNYSNTTGTRNVTVTGTMTASDGTVLSSRTVTASAAPAPLFVNALAATTSNVVFSGAGSVDSYDSSLGLYGSQTPTYSATVSSSATVNAVTPAATVQLVNTQVKGYVASLYSGGPSYSSSAKVIGPTTPLTTRIDTSRISTSPYQPVFTIKTISGTGTSLDSLLIANATTTIGTPGASTPTLYRSTGINMTGTTKLVIDGPVQLVISGNLYVGLNAGATSTNAIEVTANGSLEIFLPNASCDMAIYQGGLRNLTKDPSKLAVYSNSTLSVPDMNTTTDFYGVIYTPTGDLKVISNNGIYGAIVARKVWLSGTAPVVHYDLNLRNAVFSGIDTPYAISNWRESGNGG
jgi:hypothetical protein